MLPMFDWENRQLQEHGYGMDMYLSLSLSFLGCVGIFACFICVNRSCPAFHMENNDGHHDYHDLEQQPVL